MVPAASDPASAWVSDHEDGLRDHQELQDHAYDPARELHSSRAGPPWRGPLRQKAVRPTRTGASPTTPKHIHQKSMQQSP